MSQTVFYLEHCYDCEDGICDKDHNPGEMFTYYRDVYYRELNPDEVVICACCSIVNTSVILDMDKDNCLNCGIKGAWQIIHISKLQESSITYQDVVLKCNKEEQWKVFMKDLEQFYLRYFDGNKSLVDLLSGFSIKLYLDLDVQGKPDIYDYVCPCPRLGKLFSRGLITSCEMWEQQILKDFEK